MKTNLYSKIIFLTGASGSGKTALLNALQAELSDIATACLHFDKIGVPTQEEMIKAYGSGSEWQRAMTHQWMKIITQYYRDKTLVTLEGQVNIAYIEEAFKKYDVTHYKIILIHCNNSKRHKRLIQHRNQVELVNKQMDKWASFLKQQATERGAAIIDTTYLSLKEAVKQLKAYLA